jgi:hypothetical protein
VAAIENIRLDLLRLQMGNAGLESVTASLEAAQRVGAQIGEAVAAQDEVERLLRQVTPARAFPVVPVDATEIDDDADTPIDGVPATHA